MLSLKEFFKLNGKLPTKPNSELSKKCVEAKTAPLKGLKRAKTINVYGK